MPGDLVLLESEHISQPLFGSKKVDTVWHIQALITLSGGNKFQRHINGTLNCNLSKRTAILQAVQDQNAS